MWKESRVFQYGFACTSVLVAAGLTRVVWPLPPASSPLLFIAVMGSAWYGGMGAALVAIALAAAYGAYFTNPLYSPVVGLDDFVQLVAFVTAAVIVSSLQENTRRSAERFRQAKDAAEAASRAKDHFLAILSHELRAPLNPALLLASGIADDPTVPPSARADAAAIRENIELEARLISDLLDLSRLANGKMHVRLRPLDVHEVIRQAAASCRADGEAKGLRIGLELWARRHQISGDSSKLYQVFTNLIGNAVKFTPAGGSLSIRSDDRAGDQIRIEVQDSGIGIEPEAIARIFDPFDQGDDVVTRNFGGLGLGLAISKNLVGLHGGTIAASSAGKGHGAMFTILIPVLPDEQRVDQLELQETKI